MLRGKTAVVTGCMKGIGLSALRAFAENRADVFACYQAETEESVKEAEELSAACGVSITPVYFDLNDNEEIKSAAREIQKHKKNIDILVNIAGINKDALFPMVTMGDMLATFQINFFSQILFSQYMVKLMARGGNGGSIINTSSMVALDGGAGQLAYSASKAAWLAATKTMAIELGSGGIRVNAVAPGVIDTDMYTNVPQSVKDEKLGRICLGRMGTPDEVARLMVFLASDAASHITGQVIRADGGWRI